MSNPWLKKNPYMSLWLSSANRVAGASRGQIAGHMKRQATAAVDKAAQDIISLWFETLTAASKPIRRKS